MGSTEYDIPGTVLPNDVDFEHDEQSTVCPRISISPPPSVAPTTTINLLEYLTEPTQPVNLVRQVSAPPSRGLVNYFWWDIRNLRSWGSFCVPSISAIPGLFSLLTTPVDSGLFPITPPPNKTATPDSETALIDLVNKIYAPKVNAALALSQGVTSLSLYPVPAAERSLNGSTLR